MRAQRQYLLLHWLEETTWSTAGLKILKLRLHYERRTWDQKFGRIHDLCEKITQDSEINRTILQGVLSNTSSATAGIVGRVTGRINILLRRDLVELHRLLGYEVKYSQCLASECLIRTADNPGLLRRSIGILQGHLQTTSQQAGTVVERLRNMEQNLRTDALSRFTQTADEFKGANILISAEVNALNMVIALFNDDAAGEKSPARGPLASVPIVRRKIRESEDLQRAALHAYQQISDRNVQRIIRTWLSILAVNEDLRTDTSRAIDEDETRSVAEVRQAREEETSVVLALRYLDRQEQLEANRVRGLETMEEDNEVDAQFEDALSTSGITEKRKKIFTQGEQDRLAKRRR